MRRNPTLPNHLGHTITTGHTSRTADRPAGPLPIRWTRLTIRYDDFPAVVVPRMGPNRANFRSNEWEVVVTDGK